MKDFELKLIVELMKNSRRRDRELAKAVGVSQPTISRTIKRLEKEGYIKEYTIIPDFAKLGYSLLGFTLVKQRYADDGKVKEIKNGTARLEQEHPFAKITAVHGVGLGKSFLFSTFYRDYAEFAASMERIKELPVTDVDSIETFLVETSNPKNSRLLTMSRVANHAIVSHRGDGPEEPPE